MWFNARAKLAEIQGQAPATSATPATQTPTSRLVSQLSQVSQRPAKPAPLRPGPIAPIAPIAPRSRSSQTWTTQDFIDYYEERAAVRQFDGGQSKAEAEAAALTDTIAQWLAMHPLIPDGMATCCRQCAKAIGPHALAVLAPPGHVWVCNELCHAALLEARKAEALAAVAAMLDLTDGNRP